MDETLLEQLLHTSEGERVDFKESQYAFNGSDESKRIEVLKDILGFANAWRDSDSYILIGVREVIGGVAEVIGINPDEHLKDNDLQQYVTTKTHPPVQFRYGTFNFKEKSIGFIHIPLQECPFYLKEKHNNLGKDLVFVRRGSSTDPRSPAKPDEIYRMGKLSHAPPPVSLELEPADPRTGEKLELPLTYKTVLLSLPPNEAIPDCPESRGGGVESLFSKIALGAERYNQDFFREVAEYEFCRHLMRPVVFRVTNTSQVVADGVRVELSVPSECYFSIDNLRSFPRVPPKRELVRMPDVSKASKAPGSVRIQNQRDKVTAVIDFGRIQPGRSVLSEPLLVAAFESGCVKLGAIIFADNLKMPIRSSFELLFEVAVKSMNLDELSKVQIPPKEKPLDAIERG